MSMAIMREGKQIGDVSAIVSRSGLRIDFYKGEEITEIQLRALFGTATIEILETVEGSGCYEKVRSCLISGWELFAAESPAASMDLDPHFGGPRR